MEGSIEEGSIEEGSIEKAVEGSAKGSAEVESLEEAVEGSAAPVNGCRISFERDEPLCDDLCSSRSGSSVMVSPLSGWIA